MMRCKDCQKEWEEDELSEIFMNERETKFFGRGVEKGKSEIIQGVINALIEYRDTLKKKRLGI